MSFVGEMPVDDETASRKARLRNTGIAAFSNLSTAYNLVNINLAHVIMENQYCGGDNCKEAVTTAGTACLVGAIAGQLTFGYVGDCIGRPSALKLTMVLSILGALASAFAVPITDDPLSVFWFISATRFIMGIGVGGVYPLAATIAAESSANANRGRTVSLVFSMQGVGTLLVPLVGMVFLYIFGDYETRNQSGSQFPGIAWRLILGMGALPGIILMFVKAAGPAPARQRDVAGPAGRATITLREALSTRRYWPKLLGCAGGWFLFDITFYGNTLFAPTVLKSVFHSSKSGTPVIGSTLEDNLCWQLAILALIGLPGYYIATCFMDKYGRKNIQLHGFVWMFLLYGLLGIFLTSLQKSSVLLLIVYGLTYFFSNFGPNSTTFILPSETFPVEVRTTLNGFCAAMGKVGATLGSAAFKPVTNNFGSNVAFYMCSVCAILGVIVTGFFVEDRRGRDMGGGSIIGPDDTREECSLQDNTNTV
jgi:PHS family inorganic phosphate transporter-like MFS transporter